MALTEQAILEGLAEIVNEETGLDTASVQFDKSFTDDLDIVNRLQRKRTHAAVAVALQTMVLHDPRDAVVIGHGRNSQGLGLR